MKDLFARIGRFVEARPGSILAGTLVLIVLAVLGATQTHIDTTQEAFVDRGSDTSKNSTAFARAFGSDPVVVMIPGTPAELTSPEGLAKVKSLTDAVGADNEVLSCTSVLTLLGVAQLPTGVSLDQPGVATGIVFGTDGKPTANFAQLFPNGHELIDITLKPGLSVEQKGQVSRRVEDAVKAAGLPSGTVVAGYPRLYGEIASSIIHDMAVTAVVAVFLMIAVLYIVFPVRRRLMALPVVVVGVLFTFGITGAAGISLTLVTMAGLPILLGLGMDFAIQFHNRYEEELGRGDTPAAGLIHALTHIGPAVGTAVLATILGFLALLLSAVPAVRDFGLLLAVGVGVLYCLSLVGLNALLYRFDKVPARADRKARAKAAASEGKASEGKAAPRTNPRFDIGHYLTYVSSAAIKVAPLTLTAAVLFAIGGLYVDHFIPVQTDIAKLVPADAPGVVAMNQVRDVTGSSSYVQFLVQAGDVTSPKVLGWMAEFQAREAQKHSQIVGSSSLASLLGVKSTADAPGQLIVAMALTQIPPSIRSGLISDDHRSASIMFNLTPMSTQDQADLIVSMQADASPPAGRSRRSCRSSSSPAGLRARCGSSA